MRIALQSKVALVHDDLVQWGGAERMLLALSELFPEAPIYTSVFDKSNTLLVEKFKGKKIVTSFIQKIPAWRGFYRALLPLYPVAFEQFNLSGYEVVISQTTRFAKSIITKPETLHICYCHTPPRFLWNFSGEKVPTFLKPYLSFLRVYDQVASSRVDQWVAGSDNAKRRIEKIYHATPKVIYPFVDMELFSEAESFRGGYFLVVSRLNRYKCIDLAVKAANELKFSLKIVGDGPERQKLEELAGPTIEFLGNISDDILIKLLAGADALIVSAEEDFGLMALEAQALGKPVVAFKSGGALESVIDGETGFLFPDQSVESILEALAKLERSGYNTKRCLEQAKRFSKQKFTQQFLALLNSL